MNEYKIYCGGKFTTSEKILIVKNPYDNSIVGKTYLANETIINEAIIKALKVQNELKHLPSYLRYSILMSIVEQLSQNRRLMAEIISNEAAKPIKYSLSEVERAIQTFIIAAEETKRLPKEYMSLDWTPAGAKKEGFVKYFPIGLIAGIAPFNFPLNLAVHKLAPAIASGNPIILKPASSTPLTVLELAKYIDYTDLPKGAISILPADRISGNLLVTDERIKMLSFTGSPEVGWKMKENAGKKKICLELGGNAGVIITQTCDIENAVNKCITGAFSYSGQVCIHTQRIYIHESVFDKFSNKFIEKAKELKFGNPLDNETDVTSMIDEPNAIRVENWVNEALNDGAKVLSGGKRNETFFEPTIITNTKNDMKVCCNEVFGPVVIIEKYTDFAKAVELINNTEFGLQAGIFTNTISEMDYAFENIECGGVLINETPTFRVDHMPYGGIKDSGFGREGVKYAILEMMEPKILVK
ncbi:MAG: aldehyde dehydrogenase [Bacteroidetes bacterium GWA2_31_9]|nr:MAG: aldehyde dehydrogenase [Bacteroidetes bacterium GWA2_31_9]